MSTLVHHKRKFFDFFPTPKFLEMPSVGIDISDQAIRFVEISHSESRHQRFQLKSFGEKKITDGVITYGFVNKPEEIKKLLIEIHKKHGFKFVSISLPEEKGYLFKTELPNIEEKYIAENIELRLEENVPIDATKSVFDYNLIRPHDAAGNREGAVVTVVPSKVIDAYSDLFQSSSLLPVSYELVTHAVARAIVSQDEMGTCLIVYVGDTRTGFGIVSDGALQFTSTLNVGRAVDQADVDKKRSLLKDEIVKLKSYWQDRNEKNNDFVKRVIICGKAALALGLKEHLAEVVDCHVELANVWINAFSLGDQIPEMSFEDSLDYAPAIGLALSRFFHA
jgi:Tfp pilus assembly PilM family ATPase